MAGDGLSINKCYKYRRKKLCSSLRKSRCWCCKRKSRQRDRRRLPIRAEGKGFFPPTFHFSRGRDEFAPKSRQIQEIASSGCSPLYPIVSPYGDREQGQNRDKFWLAESFAGSGTGGPLAVMLLVADTPNGCDRSSTQVLLRVIN